MIEEIKCKSCGSAFTGQVIHKRKYCSRICYAKGRTKNEDRDCLNCGKSYKPVFKRSDGKLIHNKTRKYCSLTCSREANIEITRENHRKGKGCPKGLGHPSEKIWRIRSPRNKTYCFKNLAEFVRTNKHLFNDEDLVIKDNKNTVAERGLMCICPRRKEVRGSWKGWTWVSQTERIHNEGRDFLERP